MLLPFVVMAQPAGMVREGDRFVRDFQGSGPIGKRLRVNAHGPVTVQAGTGSAFSYTVRVSVHARTETEARRVLEHYAVHVARQGETTVLTAPGGPVVSTVIVKAPRLEDVVIATSDGAVDASGVDGRLDVNTGAGEVTADRIRGDCKLVTGGGDIHVGSVGGALQCSSGAGRIQVGNVRGSADLQSAGGDILANEILGVLRAETGGGGIHISRAGAGVTAVTGGGQVIVDQAAGVVSVRNLAGPVNIGSAAGVQCESVSGGIHINNVAGGFRASTSLGNIVANLLAGKLTDSFLATANGDITVFIPSNVGVNIRAQNDTADSTKRIAVDFPGVQVRRQGRVIVAEGAVNGGGPLLAISTTVGTIYIRKQR